MVIKLTKLTESRRGQLPDRRLSVQPIKDRLVGEFQFAQTTAQIYKRGDGSLYIKFPKGDMDIKLCEDGKVIIGKAPPTEIVPSLRDALSRI